jgi:hypothetical protein
MNFIVKAIIGSANITGLIVAGTIVYAHLLNEPKATSGKYVTEMEGHTKVTRYIDADQKEYTTPAQQSAAQTLIRASGYDCQTISAMLPFALSEGYHVYCNNHRYSYELANHGGRWSVTAN